VFAVRIYRWDCVLCCQLDQSSTLRQEENLTAYHEYARSFADQGPKGRLDFAGTTCIQNQRARAEDPCSTLYDSSFSAGLEEVGRVDEYCDLGAGRHQIVCKL